MAHTITKKSARIKEDENSPEVIARHQEFEAHLERSLADLKAGRLVRYR